MTLRRVSSKFLLGGAAFRWVLGSLFVLVSVASIGHSLATPNQLGATFLDVEDNSQAVLDFETANGATFGDSQVDGATAQHSRPSDQASYPQEFIMQNGIRCKPFFSI